jgi:hypothetical protein
MLRQYCVGLLLPATHTYIILGQKLHFSTVRTVDRTKDRSECGMGTGLAVQSLVFSKCLKTGPDRTNGTLAMQMRLP